MNITEALAISAIGMDAQTHRLQVIAEALSDDGDGGAMQGYGDAHWSDGTARARHYLTVVAPRPEGKGTSYPAMPGGRGTPNLDGLTTAQMAGEEARLCGANLSVLEATRGLLTRTVGLLG